jgi:hypothetical protein
MANADPRSVSGSVQGPVLPKLSDLDDLRTKVGKNTSRRRACNPDGEFDDAVSTQHVLLPRASWSGQVVERLEGSEWSPWSEEFAGDVCRPFGVGIVRAVSERHQVDVVAEAFADAF